ncbi:pyridoxal-phosphate dependent enzyme [Roseimarinus sediminis]|uniref:pyridoxal-phosphate dependent enzyme n=1 Tax=Roseimarinus sediminis TaxID=1610899 RepID=UPI003D1AFB0D
MLLPQFVDIETAHQLVKKFAHRTPVMTSVSINGFAGASLFFKCENLQKVGAFKFRGAINAVFSLSEEEAANGVATHSSGNHAAALALAARKRGIPAYVVMPANAPEIKKKAVAGYGAKITYCEPTLAARESTLKKLIAATGASEIHPYNNFKVIAGQGTAAKELLEEVGALDLVLCPVGGGGLLSGTALAVKALSPKTRVVACEPAGADDACRSFYGDRLVPSVQPNTIADGLLTSLGEMNYKIIKKQVDEVVTVSEASIVQAMRMVWERMKIIIEPSSAVPLAAILEHKVDVADKKVGIIISGGNVDLERLPF